MRLSEVLLEEAESVYAVTEKLFRRVRDEDLGWRPASSGVEWMTAGQLLMHCASFGCGKAVRGFATGDWGRELAEYGGDDTEAKAHLPAAAELPAVRSVDEALRLLETDRVLALRALAEVDDTALLAGRRPAPWGGAELTLFQHLLHMIQHLAQHKGQLFYYLKLMGGDVRTPDLWGV
jgi:uncharacterized damage-inducible protein DinB